MAAQPTPKKRRHGGSGNAIQSATRISPIVTMVVASVLLLGKHGVQQAHGWVSRQRPSSGWRIQQQHLQRGWTNIHNLQHPRITARLSSTLKDIDNSTTSTPANKPSQRQPKKISLKKIQNTADSKHASPPPINDFEASESPWPWTEENWKTHPELNPTLEFSTWAVPLKNAKIIQALLSSELTQPYLATRDEILQQCHPRPKIVQDGIDDDRGDAPKTHKYILLHPEHSQNDLPLPPEVKALLAENNVIINGPNMSIDIQYHQFPVNYILGKLLPKSVHPPPTAFEMVGHVAHLNLRENHLPYAKMIGHVLLDCLPTIETVIQKVGQVSGPYRTFEYQVLAGRNDTTVKLMEHGVRLEFDLSKVYWCSRLASERQVVLDQEILPGQVIADAFCGVGAICLRAAQTKNCTILANDWNPNAVKYLKHNFALNRLDQYLKLASTQDSYDFLMDLGAQQEDDEPDSSIEDKVEKEDDNNSAMESKVSCPVDHVLMNFPLKAPTFLGALRWWSPPLSQSSPRLHVYTFARADHDTHRSEEDVAIDLIASELLPPMGGGNDDEDGGETHRKQELDSEYGCNVIAREIRDVAPGKLVYCVSFTATPKLLRHMQGEFD